MVFKVKSIIICLLVASLIALPAIATNAFASTTTYTDANWGITDRRDGILVQTNAESWAWDKRALTDAYVISGLGTPGWAVADTGKIFTKSGSGVMPAIIGMTGTYQAYTDATPGGSATSNVKFIVQDLTTGQTMGTSNIGPFPRSCSNGGSYTDTSTFNNGISLNMQGGHQYKVYLETRSDANGFGMLVAHSLLRSGNPSDPWGAKYDQITVTT